MNQYHSVIYIYIYQSLSSGKSLCKQENIVLKHTYFELEIGKKFYHEISGTKIRTQFAPPCTNIIIMSLEEEIFE